MEWLTSSDDEEGDAPLLRGGDRPDAVALRSTVAAGPKPKKLRRSRITWTPEMDEALIAGIGRYSKSREKLLKILRDKELGVALQGLDNSQLQSRVKNLKRLGKLA